MNNRILELAEQASVEYIASLEWVFTQEELLKFAESIVKDCINNMENCDGDLDFAIWKTKKDFGIKS